MQKLPGHLDQESDIGSGEKSPGQRETDKLIEQVGSHENEAAGRTPSAVNHPQDREPEPRPATPPR
jgi:hypothetical protein